MNNQGRQLLTHNNRFPTSKRDYTIVTPMMKDVYDIVSNELEKMEIGVSMYSASRFGKTRALDYIEEQTRKDSPSVTLARVVMISMTTNSDRKFFEHVMGSINKEDDLQGSGGELRSRIEQFFLVRCSENQDPRILLMIDEAQRMTPQNFSNLIDLTNHLERYGMAPTVLSMGQPELLDRRDLLLKEKRKDAVGRFLDNPIAFEGVTSIEPLPSILQQYDDHLSASFPTGSGTCITAAYVPDLYRKGFRLENCKNPMWNAFTSSASELDVEAIVGMRSLTRAIEAGLTNLAVSGLATDAVNANWWKKILLESGYLRHLMTISEPWKQ